MKKILALCLVVVLAVTAVAGATLAYFTDTEKATNTMTFGNIDIELKEQMLNEEGNAFVPYEDQKLYPISDEQGINLWNKYVYTKNVSGEGNDVYVRTIVAFEYNEQAPDGLHFAYTQANLSDDIYGSTYTDHGIIEIDGAKYDVVVFEVIGEKALKNNQRLDSLGGVWIDKDVTDEQIKGWGDDIKILVLSQAIQADGLTYAQAMTELGEINATNLSDWF